MKKLIVLTLFMMVIGGCAQAELFQGSAQGHGGEVTVLFEVKGNWITKFRAEGENETMGQIALYEMSRSIVNNGVEFTDVVAGATVTSEAILKAVKSAVPLVISEHEAQADVPALFDPAKTTEQMADDYYRPIDENWDGSAYSLRLCTFEEDGIQRSMLVCYDEDTGKCYDYFNGRYVFYLFPDPLSSVSDPMYPSQTYFLPHTHLSRAELSWLMGNSNEAVWNAHHAFNDLSTVVDTKEMSPSAQPESGQGRSFWEVLFSSAVIDDGPAIPDYRDNYRAFYELTIPQEIRFPRIQPSAQDASDSQVPKEKDSMPFTTEDADRTHVITAYYTHDYKAVFFVYQKSTNGNGTAWYDLFNDALLFTQESADDPLLPNVDYLNALRPGAQLLLGEKENGYKPGEAVLSTQSLTVFLEHNSVGKRISRFCQDAETIGDVRRAYEQLPSMYWAWPPEQPQTSIAPETGSAVRTFLELEEAFRTAKSGATILLANDIPLHTGLTIPKKKLTLSSASDEQPFALYRALGYERELLTISSGSTLTLENVRIDGRMVQNQSLQKKAAMVVEKGASLVLGARSSVENHAGESVVYGHYGSTITLDGGAVRHNHCGFGVIKCFGKFTLKAGEINDNQVLIDNVLGTVLIGGDGKLLMTGGAIHHNIVPSGGGAIYIQSGKATAEIKGGEIHHNYGTAGAIYSAARTLTLSGGSIHHNVGDNTGAIFASPGAWDGNTKFIMTGGEITENRTLSTGGNFGSSGVHIEGMEWTSGVSSSKFKGSFDMRGGAIRNNRGGMGVGLLIYSVDGSATIGPKAVVEGNTILTMAGGKLKDQRPKNNK